MIPIKYCKIRPFHLLLTIMSVFAAIFFPFPANAAETGAPGVIVLDPGHGGKDQGAVGSNSHVEKAAALSLAAKISEKLVDAYTVYMTRTDDYDMTAFDRTSTANHHKADVFISIHAGGSFLRQTKGFTVFYFDSAGESTSKIPRDVSPDITSPTEDPLFWDEIQSRHTTRSKKLAETIKSVFTEKSVPTHIQNAPLLVLRGADMPAVLVEFGYITNPTDENSLFDPKRLDEYADMVKTAMDRFLKKSPGDNG
jgi:N-acetylmuramoyl-L-alanine amidase